MHNPRTLEAYQLLHDGSIALAEVEKAGMPVDLEYCKRESKRTLLRANRLKEEILESDTGKLWKRIYGPRLNLNSPNQMRHIFFNILKLEPVEWTDTGRPALDAQALDIMQLRYTLPFVQDFIRMKRLMKAEGTYLRAFSSEAVDGVVHPFFHLHTVRSFRGSCIAGYEKVAIIPKGSENPVEIPIKDVKVGDMVYCVDDNLNPQIKKVLWQGKTGDREVVRVHYYRRGKRGHIDCTPEHRIRMIDGSYVEAQDLLKKQHYEKKHPKEPNVRVLACLRSGDEVAFTHHRKSGRGLKEHRFLYEKLIGPLAQEDVIHHKDRDHSNNALANLQKMTKGAHATHHAPETIQSEQTRANNLIAVQKAHKEGRYHYPAGEDHAHYLGLSRQMCLRILARGRGKIKAGADANGTDFDTLKKYLKIHDIDWRTVKLRYDKNGKYISKRRLEKLHPLGRKAVSKLLGHNHYKLKELYDHYGLDTKRKWGNQFGAFAPGNHRITGVEWIKKIVPVYDLEVEDCHNFFVNEICVHNSSGPNFQNQPLRDPEMGKLVRGAIKAPEGYCIVENDYSGMEVGIGACSHLDRNMISYITDKTKDMHRDSAMELFKLREDQMSKEIRQAAKGGFVFPQFYGSYYVECAKNLWDAVSQQNLTLADGTSLRAHMDRSGLSERGECDPEVPTTAGTFEHHVQNVERILWEERFPIFALWRREIYDSYKQNLFFDSLTGFRYTGYFRRNEVINFGTQGSAFHCLLRAVIILVGELKARGMKTRVIGQIHDSIVSLVKMEEQQEYLDLVYDIMANRVKKEWAWIVVPLEVDADVAPEAGSWAEKAPWVKTGGIWGPKKEK